MDVLVLTSKNLVKDNEVVSKSRDKNMKEVAALIAAHVAAMNY